MCVFVCVCLHVLGLNLLALQHVCSLSKQADRQRGQTGCYKTQPGEEKKNPGEERVKGFFIQLKYVVHAIVHYENISVVMCVQVCVIPSPVLQIFVGDPAARLASKCYDISLCVCVCDCVCR